MPRTIIRYDDSGPPQWGVLFGRIIAPLRVDVPGTGELLSGHWEWLWSIDASQATVARESVRLLSPVTKNQQFICQGVNYRSHIAESGLRVEDFPFNTIFTKAPSCITSADARVVRPPHVRLLDYEIELGLVLQRDLPSGTRVGTDDLHTWLTGVTIVNDLSHLAPPEQRLEALDEALLPRCVPLGWVAIVRPDRCVLAEGPVSRIEELLQRALERVMPSTSAAFTASPSPSARWNRWSAQDVA